MIYVRLEAEDFRYEIEDILRLFYRKEDMTVSLAEPPEGYQGVFVLISGTIEDLKSGKPGLSVELRADGKTSTSAISPLLGPDCMNISKLEMRKTLKKALKSLLYKILARHTRKNPPWGVLTGIRPAKIVQEMLQKGCGKNEIFNRMEHEYYVSQDKINLAYEVALKENKVLKETPRNAVSVYIGIPFCPTRCLYCSFTSNSIDRCRHLLDGYIEALQKEIRFAGKLIKQKGCCIQSMYIGGGTPTSLDEPHLRKLLDTLENDLDLSCLKEYTLEAGRPDSIDRCKLKTIKDSRVDRISINPQTMNDETLKLIGRRHSSQDIITAFELARDTGFDNINMDVIVGLPDETVTMFEHTLRKIKELMPESLTVHTLAVKRASALNEKMEEYKLTSDNDASAMVEIAGEYARSMDMHPYYLYRQKNILGNLENIGYCRNGYESIYNIQIMEEKQTIIALGAGAVTKVVYPSENRIERAFNVKNIEEYIRRIDEMIERKKSLIDNR